MLVLGMMGGSLITYMLMDENMQHMVKKKFKKVKNNTDKIINKAMN